jgi:hypothetical protein
MKVQFAHRIERFDRLGHACNRDCAQQDDATDCHWDTTYTGPAQFVNR